MGRPPGAGDARQSPCSRQTFIRGRVYANNGPRRLKSTKWASRYSPHCHTATSDPGPAPDADYGARAPVKHFTP